MKRRARRPRSSGAGKGSRPRRSPETAAGNAGPPLLVQLERGDIAAATASVVVVNHFNGLPPAGAEKAVDDALRGAISRAAARGMLQTSFASTRFFPAARAALPAEVVLVVGLGEPERFSAQRLPEIGSAVVEAMASAQLPDAATIVHGAGLAGADPREAVVALVKGVLAARARVPGGEGLRSVTFVERDATRLEIVRDALASAHWPPGAEFWLMAGGSTRLVQSSAPAARPGAPAAGGSARASTAAAILIPPHTRLGITRSGGELKVTVIGHGALDWSQEHDYPAELATKLLGRVQDEVLGVEAAEARRAAMLGIGEQLRRAFLAPAQLDVVPLLSAETDVPLVLRLDRSTVQMPWELLRVEDRFVSRSRIVARQLEGGVPGRTAPAVDDDGALDVLVIGDPAGNLRGARAEAEAVLRALHGLPGVQVQALVGKVRYTDLSRALDTTPFDVVHYAGHATHDSLRGTALLLADTLITAEDLATRRYLPRFFFGNGCYSGATGGETEMLVGTLPALVTGLLSAGVRAFIGAQWPVNDRAAKTFAIALYRALLAGDTIGAATRLAREAVVAAHGEGEPAWAAYALYGPPWFTVR